MFTELKVLYLYNSGVLLSYGEDSILIDGVFDNRNIFDKMPPGYRETLLRKDIPFEHVNGLLFTHCHDDHYDGETVELLADKHGDIDIIAPIGAWNNKLKGECGELTIGMFKVEYLKTRHIFVGPLTCDNYVYKITAGDRSVIITGDTDPESLGKIIDAFGYDADVFLINAATFLYEMKRPEDTLLKQVKNLHIYHLPNEENDDYGYRRATVSIISKAEKYLSNTKDLLDNVRYI